MRARLSVVLFLGWAAAGCYEASFPLDRAPQTDLPNGLVGSWRCLPGEPDQQEDAISVTVKRSKDRVYEITLQEKDQAPDRYEAYASLVKGAPIINLKDLDTQNDKPWSFLRTTFLRPDILWVQVVSERAVAAGDGSAAGIRKLLESAQEKADLFEEAAVCARVKPR